MDTSLLILKLLNGLAYVLTGSFAVSAYIILFRLCKSHRRIEVSLHRIEADVWMLNIHNDFDTIKRMRDIMKELIDNEQYEQASKMNKELEKAQEFLQQQLKEFNEVFGHTYTQFTDINVKKQ